MSLKMNDCLCKSLSIEKGNASPNEQTAFNVILSEGSPTNKLVLKRKFQMNGAILTFRFAKRMRGLFRLKNCGNQSDPPRTATGRNRACPSLYNTVYCRWYVVDILPFVGGWLEREFRGIMPPT
jgi:hypothetical protein